ncbi:hypothetical protein H4582DRAFT_2055825 [Lactarius indigo]|nr:hypothetical protein H4582DRAFT_2055825 [Lactarius indigo]
MLKWKVQYAVRGETLVQELCQHLENILKIFYHGRCQRDAYCEHLFRPICTPSPSLRDGVPIWATVLELCDGTINGWDEPNTSERANWINFFPLESHIALVGVLIFRITCSSELQVMRNVLKPLRTHPNASKHRLVNYQLTVGAILVPLSCKRLESVLVCPATARNISMFRVLRYVSDNDPLENASAIVWDSPLSFRVDDKGAAGVARRRTIRLLKL